MEYLRVSNKAKQVHDLIIVVRWRGGNLSEPISDRSNGHSRIGVSVKLSALPEAPTTCPFSSSMWGDSERLQAAVDETLDWSRLPCPTNYLNNEGWGLLSDFSSWPFNDEQKNLLNSLSGAGRLRGGFAERADAAGSA